MKLLKYVRRRLLTSNFVDWFVCRALDIRAAQIKESGIFPFPDGDYEISGLEGLRFPGTSNKACGHVEEIIDIE